MKYLLLIYGNHEGWNALGEDRGALDAAHRSVIDELTASRELLDSNELDGLHSAVVRRDASDAVLVTEGPFVEGREIVGGYYLVDCVSQDRAVEIAARLEETRYSLVDVRPVVS